MGATQSVTSESCEYHYIWASQQCSLIRQSTPRLKSQTCFRLQILHLLQSHKYHAATEFCTNETVERKVIVKLCCFLVPFTWPLSYICWQMFRTHEAKYLLHCECHYLHCARHSVLAHVQIPFPLMSALAPLMAVHHFLERI